MADVHIRPLCCLGDVMQMRPSGSATTGQYPTDSGAVYSRLQLCASNIMLLSGYVDMRCHAATRASSCTILCTKATLQCSIAPTA